MEPISPPPNPFVADSPGATLALPSLQECFFLPGDWALYLLARYAQPVAALLDIGPDDYGATAAASAAILAWFALAIVLIVTVTAVRNFDRTVTRGIVTLTVELRRRVRMAVTFARYRRDRRVPRKEPSFELHEEPSLSRDELRVLDAHAKVMPGYALAVSDVAELLEARGYEVHTALQRLHCLKLLQSTVGGLDGETAYTLTPFGRALLVRQRRPSGA
jgi:hypothetical protein